VRVNCLYAAEPSQSTAVRGSVSSPSGGDVISEDWWLRFSDYRLEDYYAVQARLDNDAARPFPTLTLPANTPPDSADLQHALYSEPFSRPAEGRRPSWPDTQ